jgi:hypothetical protein
VAAKTASDPPAERDAKRQANRRSAGDRRTITAAPRAAAAITTFAVLRA